MPAYVGCTVKQLPSHLHVEAARAAIALNPANAPAKPPALAALAPAPPLPPERLALLTSKYWGAKGVRLTVSFLDNPDQATRNKILLHMNAWNRTANVTFTEVASQGQVRIARAAEGYWSYLGTDILTVPLGNATMNLQDFSAQGTPDSEFYRVVRHEVGHTLGFPHEHARREIVARLDPARTVAYFLRTQGWNEQTVRQQVLTPLSAADLDVRSLPSDVRSIMCYDLPGDITVDGQPIPGGNDIDDEDYNLCAKLYPRDAPPPPPPPSGAHKLFSLDFTGRPVPRGGRVTFLAPVPVPPERFDLVPALSGGSAGTAIPETQGESNERSTDSAS